MGLKSFFILGALFFWHCIKRLLFLDRLGRDRGLGRFYENYQSEGLTPFNAEDHEVARHLARCTDCGLCDSACPILVGNASASIGSVSFLAAAGWRDSSAHRFVRKAAGILAECDTCTLCEGVCPERIPLLAAARFMVRSGKD